MIRVVRPTEADLRRLAVDHQGDNFTYDAVGATLTGDTPPSYRAQSFQTAIGSGIDTFQRAATALSEWWPQRGSGITVGADGAVAPGRAVALAAPLPIGFAVAVCRVVDVVDEPARYGFAYGTLPMHPEEGEELFMVEQRNDEVTFRITVFSRPHELLARLAAPIARRLQASATDRYLSAMRSLPT